MTLSSRDRALIWHPFTQEQTAELPIVITKGQGSYLYDEHNNAYLDLISSWWVNLHGHANIAIANAIHQQALKLEHVIFAGFTHEPAVELCERLKALLPPHLARFFFSDNGSTAVEVAMKMAYQYWQNKGDFKRNKFVSFVGGYHGDTFGAMNVGRRSGFHDQFQELFFESVTISYPNTWDGDAEVEQKEHESLMQLQQLLVQEHQQIAAFIAEPLVQGAGGMRMCRPYYLKQVVSLLREYNILIIFDEVMTGFGRTGANFAFEIVGCVPDFLCLSKGLTGGFLPLALTITSNHIYEAFLSNDFNTAFAHGHSYTANPLGCAAAKASLDLLLTTKTQSAIQTINSCHLKYLPDLMQHCKFLKNSRVRGTIAAFELDTNYAYSIKDLKEQFLAKRLLLRPLESTIYLLPPYSITADELNDAYLKIASIITKHF
ncbi:adenosylmethionine--8-amino-7-oxononanoate transaminase [Candidatus Trichorickettsia mobilis]|uniref:adenosylmethionine--8-amino-7-oxononanoate transaminase n=1 Tax=Candidatus Trichorickettsia mobilis TaxID=1346319 RepID=UPI0029317A34|nr:adenosylmethionine--8-amino-7-oxononanoate transaminase [Candidatus Trichorickettsia mobilis]